MAKSKTTSRPNILLITVDQWPGPLLGVAGHPVIQTPTIDALANMGVRYNRAYSECPICIPARRTLMTGTTPKTHGDRVFGTVTPMPALPTIAQTFRDGGYQAYAVGKLHVYPPRDRIGYDDVILAEEGRPHLGAVDDYDMYLADRGHAGQQFGHGMNNNNYMYRPWHLPEDCHVTNWSTAQMCRTIKRRDPTRPAFWTLSYTHPHPPLAPLQCYLDMYRQLQIEPALEAAWAAEPDRLPRALRLIRDFYPHFRSEIVAEIRRAFYALCTHIDHQLRLVIGTLREEGLLDDTVILLTADHGDMLGDFGLFAKRTFYERSANIPMIVAGPPGDPRIRPGTTDSRLVGLQDIMPTLLTMAGLPVPKTCDGMDMLGKTEREMLYGDCLETQGASRMLHNGRHKLIWYPAGNMLQLFDLETDPSELHDRSEDPAYAGVRKTLEGRLASTCYGADLDQGWVVDGRLAGFDPGLYVKKADRSFSGQRGVHYPEPPALDPDKSVGFPG